MSSRYQAALTWVEGAWLTIRAISVSPRGQGLAEYALILALIAIVAIVALIFLGGQVSSILNKVGKSV